MPTDIVDSVSNESSGGVFGLPITFIEGATHNDLHELVCVFFHGSAARDHEPDPAPKLLPHLREDHFVID